MISEINSNLLIIRSIGLLAVAVVYLAFAAQCAYHVLIQKKNGVIYAMLRFFGSGAGVILFSGLLTFAALFDGLSDYSVTVFIILVASILVIGLHIFEIWRLVTSVWHIEGESD